MSSLYLSPVFPLYWLLPAAVLLLIILAWLEWRKAYRYKALRVFAQALAILAVLAMMLRPSYDVKISLPGVVLLTENFSTNALDSLLKGRQGLQVASVISPTPLSPKGGRGIPAGVKVEALTSYREVEKLGKVRCVLGDGIPLPYLEYFDSYTFIPGRAPAGVVRLNITTYPEQRKSLLTGSVRDCSGCLLTLKGPGGLEDSTTVRTNALTHFQLAFTTKIPGRFVYQLTVKDSIGRKTEEEVPVEVMESRKLSILLLQEYPTPEVRFLKNYLAEKGHRLVTRYQLSRNVFRYEVANEAEKPTGSLDEVKLKAFDLVIGDDESLGSLSPSELQSAETAVRNGLGMLVLLNGQPDARKFPGNVLQLSPLVTVVDTVRYNPGGFSSFIGPFTAVKAHPRVQQVMRASGYMLQGLALHGQGKVACLALRETYRMALGGDNNVYAALWTPLLEQTSRREDMSHKLQCTTGFPVYPNEPLALEAIGNGNIKVVADSVEIPLAEDIGIDDFWHGKFWAGKPGWNSFSAGQSKANYFVSKDGAWKSLRTEVQRQANLLKDQSAPDKAQAITLQEKFPQWVFLLIFVLAMGFVWLAPKL